MQNDIHMLQQEIKNELFDQETEEPIEPEDGIDDSCDYDDNADGQDTSEENLEGDTSDKNKSCECGGNAGEQEKSEEPTKPESLKHDGNPAFNGDEYDIKQPYDSTTGKLHDNDPRYHF